VIRGNENRVLDANQLNPNDGEQVGGDQEGLAEYHRRIREADKGVEGGGDHGGLAEEDQDAQGQVATGPGSTLSPGNSPPPRGSNRTAGNPVEVKNRSWMQSLNYGSYKIKWRRETETHEPN
jgi:hypothetical protein